MGAWGAGVMEDCNWGRSCQPTRIFLPQPPEQPGRHPLFLQWKLPHRGAPFSTVIDEGGSFWEQPILSCHTAAVCHQQRDRQWSYYIHTHLPRTSVSSSLHHSFPTPIFVNSEAWRNRTFQEDWTVLYSATASANASSRNSWFHIVYTFPLSFFSCTLLKVGLTTLENRDFQKGNAFCALLSLGSVCCVFTQPDVKAKSSLYLSHHLGPFRVRGWMGWHSQNVLEDFFVGSIKQSFLGELKSYSEFPKHSHYPMWCVPWPGVSSRRNDVDPADRRRRSYEFSRQQCRKVHNWDFNLCLLTQRPPHHTSL